MNNQEREYWNNVSFIVEEAIEECEGCVTDAMDYIQESVDGSEYIIYYHRNIEVLQYTDNDDALFDDGGETTFSSTMDTMQRIAYCAMLQDCYDELNRQDIDY